MLRSGEEFVMIGEELEDEAFANLRGESACRREQKLMAGRFKTSLHDLVAALIARLTFVAERTVTLVTRLTFVAKLTRSARCDAELQFLDSDFDFLHFSFTSSVR